MAAPTLAPGSKSDRVPDARLLRQIARTPPSVVRRRACTDPERVCSRGGGGAGELDGARVYVPTAAGHGNWSQSSRVRW